MIDLDQQALDFLTKHAPKFLKEAQSVEQTTEKSRRVLKIHLEQFDNNPIVLYAALYFCAKHSITVIVQPPVSTER